jgi:hypothetical protein
LIGLRSAGVERDGVAIKWRAAFRISGSPFSEHAASRLNILNVREEGNK